ncbi:MAG: hypothetical protein KGJ57_05345 [Sphingomonadales bacterium]|nr:hypothetical protein [Sphingomonadales bacterium]MDE2168841.1 hypothetical protein [Sphingomonadales bacterium]
MLTALFLLLTAWPDGAQDQAQTPHPWPPADVPYTSFSGTPGDVPTPPGQPSAPGLPPALMPQPHPPAPPVDNPLAPARMGLIECASPDVIARTCRSLARYTPQADGSFINHAEVLLLPNELVTMTIAGRARLKGNAACATLTTAMVKGATLRYAGNVVPAKLKLRFTPRILSGLARAGVLDKEVCSTQSPEGDGFIEHTTIDGQAPPGGETHLVWVRPDAGYTVGPRD